MPPIPPTKKKPISDFASALQQAASGSVADVAESPAPVSQPKGKSDFAMALEEAAKKKVGTTDGGNTSTTSAQLPSGSEAQSPSTTEPTSAPTTINSAPQTPVSDDSWIKKILQYEASHGSATGKGLSNWGYNSRNPKSIDEAVNYFKQDILPEVKDFPNGVKERMGDFMYNTGKDGRIYMLDQYLKQSGQGGLQDRGKFKEAVKDGEWQDPTVKKQFEDVWSKHESEINSLPITEQVGLLDKGRDFYYQNINRANGKPSDAYYKTWKGRLNIFGKPEDVSPDQATPSTIASSSAPAFGDGYNIATLNGAIKPEGTFNNKPVEDNSMRSILSGTNTGIANDKPTPSQAVKVGETVLPDIKEAIDSTVQEKIKRDRGVDMKTPPTRYEVEAATKMVTDAYKRGDIIPSLDGGKSVMKRSTGVAETFFKALNDAKRTKAEDAYFESLSNDERARYLNLKQEFPQSFETSDNSTTPGSKVMGINLGQVGKDINSISEFGGENAGMLSTVTTGAMALTAAAPAIAASTALVGTAGAGEFGGFLALSNDMAGFKNNYEKTYYSLKKQGLSDAEAADKAETAGRVGYATSLGVNAALSSNVGNAVSSASTEAVEGLINGLVKSTEHLVKREIPKMAITSGAASLADSAGQSAVGVDVNWGDAFKEAANAAGSGAVTALSFWGLHQAAKIATSIPSYIRPLLENVAATTPVESREAYLNKAVEQGIMTEPEKVKVSKSINEFGETKPAVQDLPIPEEKKAAITGKLIQAKKLQEEIDSLTPYGASFNDRISQLNAAKENIHADIQKMYAADDVFSVEHDSVTGEKPVTAPAVVMPNEINRPTKEVTIAPDETLKPDTKESKVSVILTESNKSPNIVSNGENKTANTGDITGETTNTAKESQALTGNESAAPKETPAEIPTDNKASIDVPPTREEIQASNKPLFRFFERAFYEANGKRHGSISTDQYSKLTNESKGYLLKLFDDLLPFHSKFGGRGEVLDPQTNKPIRDDFGKIDYVTSNYFSGLGRESNELGGAGRQKHPDMILPRPSEEVLHNLNDVFNAEYDHNTLSQIAKTGIKIPTDNKAPIDESQNKSTEVVQPKGDATATSSNEHQSSKEESTTAATPIEDKQGAKQEKPVNSNAFFDKEQTYSEKSKSYFTPSELIPANGESLDDAKKRAEKFYGMKSPYPDELIKKANDIHSFKGASSDGFDNYVYDRMSNQDNSLTSNTTENASNSSQVPEQKMPEQSGQREHARTSQEQNTEKPQTDGSNSDLGSEGRPKEKISRTKASGNLRTLSENIRKDGILPHWAKANLPDGTQSQGFGGKSLDEAVAKALDLVADAIDAGKGLSDSVNEGFAHIRDYYQNNTKSFDEKKLKEQFKGNIKKQLRASGELSGITHAETKNTREEFGLGDPYEKTTKSDEQLRADAVNEIKKGYNIDKLVSDIEKGKVPSDKETTILKIHKANLEAAIEKNPSDENLAQLRRLVKASDAAGSEQGRALRSRQGLEIRDDSLAGYFVREQDIHGDEPIPEASKKQVIKEHIEITEAQKKLDEKIAALEKENARLKAEKKVKEQAAKVSDKTKKTKEDFVNERKDIIQNIRDKWKNAAKDNMVTAVPVPYAKQLAAIAPDVAKLVRSLVEEGVTKLADVTKSIHNTLKEDFPEITEKDVHDIIAGEYGKKKSTKSEIQQKISDLRTQSQLINKLEELRKGPIPKTEKERIARSKEIEDLRQQIKDKETEYADAKGQFTEEYKKLETERNRQLKRVGELKEKLATLQSGKLPEGEKREAKVDVPEIEALKKDIEVAEKEVRKNLAQQERMKDLESELQRIKDRKAKDTKPENKRVIGDEEKKVRDAIEAEREKWNQENRMTDLQGELQRLKDRKDKTTDPKAKREIGDEEQKVRDDISKEKRIIGLEKELQRLKDRRTKDKTSPDPVSPEEQKLVDEIKKERQQWREERSGEISLSSIKSRTRSEIEKLKKQLESGNFEKEVTAPVKLDQEAIDLKDNLIKLRKERESRIIHEEYKKRTKWEKFKSGFSEVIGIPRTLMSSLDFSAPLRQALIATVAHPKLAASAGVEMFKQGFSQKRFDRWFYDIKESPRYKLMEQSGLYVADPHDPRMTAREESFMSNLGEKVPLIGETLHIKIKGKEVAKIPGAGLVRGSERAYVSYLNKMRVDLFNRMVDDFEAQGSSFEKDPKLFKDLANFVNNATGRGNLGFAESAGPVLSSTFFSPRLIASRLSLLRDVATFGNFGRMHPEVRKVMYKDMLAFVGTGLSVLALVKGSSWALNCKDENGEPCVTVEADPRSSDFGKIKSGNMRWDIWGGFQQYIRVLTQLGSGETKSSTSGQVQELDGKGQFGKTRLDQGMSFLRGKLAPAPSMLVDVLGGRTATGEKVTLKDEAVGHLLPLIASDLKDAMQDKGVKAIFTMGIPSTFGVGVSTYLPRGYEGKDVKQDPVYSFLYKKSMAIAPPVIDNVPEETRPAFISKREEIFKREWDKVIKYGGLIDENGHATTDTKRAVKRIDTDKLDREDLSDLMRSISTKSTRAAEKELNIKVGRKPKVRA